MCHVETISRVSDDQGASSVPPDPLVIDASLARRLIDSQFPQWSHLPITAVEVDGWDNRTFRLGSELTVRLPSADQYAQQVDKEQRWRRIRNLPGFATTLARFLKALGRVDATGGPTPGEHNFYRGGPLATYEDETLQAIEALGKRIPGKTVRRVWDDAMTSSWDREPVWFHGDVAAANLLVRDGRLAAVIDFGSSGVGDPACDMVIAWTLLAGASRATFRAERDVDAATWSRGRGWALWKALITLAGDLERGMPDAARTEREISRIVLDHAQDV
jgi:aminoglycoside phosphotransferase (APT) family kinase protein